MDLKVLESLIRLTSDAMQGAVGAQNAVKSLADLPSNPDEVMGWIQKNVPTVGSLSKSELFGDQFDQWFKMMGFVPRARYVELLERYEELRLKLEEAEKTHHRLESLLDPAHVASEVLNAWGSTLHKALETQSQWLSAFLGSEAPDEEEEDEASEE